MNHHRLPSNPTRGVSLENKESTSPTSTASSAKRDKAPVSPKRQPMLETADTTSSTRSPRRVATIGGERGRSPESHNHPQRRVPTSKSLNDIDIDPTCPSSSPKNTPGSYNKAESPRKPKRSMSPKRHASSPSRTAVAASGAGESHLLSGYQVVSTKNNNNSRSGARSSSPVTPPKNPPRSAHKKKPHSTSKRNAKQTKEGSMSSLPPPPEPSLELQTPSAENTTTKDTTPQSTTEVEGGDEAYETESDCSGVEISPRYVSPKGNTTHLQLDLSNMGAPGAGTEVPVFSLLDDNSLLDGSTDDEKETTTTTTTPPPSLSSSGNNLLDNNHNNNNVKKLSPKRSKPKQQLLGLYPSTLAATITNAATPAMQFQPWGDDDDDDHHHHGDDDDSDREEPVVTTTSTGQPTPSSPKGNKSPLALRKAVKALKYTKPSISGASNFVGKLSTGFQQRLGIAPQHQQMKDTEDDLDCLL